MHTLLIVQIELFNLSRWRAFWGDKSDQIITVILLLQYDMLSFREPVQSIKLGSMEL